MSDNKKILDMTCGARSIWFNKQHPAAVYCDRRREDLQYQAHGEYTIHEVKPIPKGWTNPKNPLWR